MVDKSPMGALEYDMIWPPLELPLDTTGRLAAIRQLAASKNSCQDWAEAVLEHTAKNIGLGFPLEKAMSRAAMECMSHRPETL